MNVVGAELKVKDLVEISNQNSSGNKKCMKKVLCKLEKYVNDIGYKKKYENNPKSQRDAWEEQILFLAEKFKRWDFNPELVVLFEYMLPKENTKRPDVILLFKDKVVSLEFKTSGKEVNRQYMVQFVGYGRSLRDYHQYNITNNINVESFLIMSSVKKASVTYEQSLFEKYSLEDLKKVHGKDSVDQLFQTLAQESIMSKVEVDNWIKSERGRSRKVWEEAIVINEALKDGRDGSLSRLNGIAYDYLMETDEFINNIINNEHQKNLIFVSGVPGAGKTLIGLLQLYRNIGLNSDAEYFTGNGALVNVLSQILNSHDIDNFGKFRNKYINENQTVDHDVIIFDEAQRFWTAERANTPNSDAHGIIEANYNKNITIIALIGDGQKPLHGEAGVEAWVNALQQNDTWRIWAPDNYQEKFIGVNETKISYHEELHLNTSVRAGFTDISKFIEAVLNANLDEATEQYNAIKKNENMGVDIKICRDLGRLYLKDKNGLTVLQKLKERNEENSDNPYLYGILCSSKVGKANLSKFSGELIKNSYQENNQAYIWYTGVCCDVDNITVATETFCQGLELDLPIVFFGGDYLLEMQNDGIKWKVKVNKEEEILRDTYRILLTRVTKEMMIVIPDDNDFNETYNFFKKVGLEEWPINK